MKNNNVQISLRKILAIHTGGIGDLIMATPALRTLRTTFLNTEIHFIGSPKAVEVIQNLHYVDKIIVLDTSKIKNRFFGEIFKIFRYILFLRSQRYDSLFVLQPQLSFLASLRMGLFILSLGVPERYGRSTNGKGFFLTKSVKVLTSSNRHEVERMMDVMKLSGAIPENFDLEIPISPDDRSKVSELLNHNGISKLDFLIALAPGFGKPTRRWYPERWAQLGDLLADTYNAKILLISALKEIELAAQIASLMKNTPIITAGKTTIAQTACLLERCRLVVSNDSGPMHLAQAVGANIIALFGPGDCNRIRPYGNPNKYIIVTKKVDCAPCYKLTCKDHRCMKDITVDDVFQAAVRLISSCSPMNQKSAGFNSCVNRSLVKGSI